MVALHPFLLPVVRGVDALYDQRACLHAFIAGLCKGKAATFASLLRVLGRFSFGRDYIVPDGEYAFFPAIAVAQLEPIAPCLNPVGLHLQVKAIAICELVGLFPRLSGTALSVGKWHGCFFLSVPGIMGGVIDLYPVAYPVKSWIV
ncbi:hypothetical protein FQZ97_944530 [compost metagenome]